MLGSGQPSINGNAPAKKIQGDQQNTKIHLGPFAAVWSWRTKSQSGDECPSLLGQRGAFGDYLDKHGTYARGNKFNIPVLNLK